METFIETLVETLLITFARHRSFIATTAPTARSLDLQESDAIGVDFKSVFRLE